MKSDKAIKKLTVVAIILIILLLVCISFFGILKHDLNTWKNILPEYSFSKELTGSRIFSFEVDKSTKEVEDTSDEESEEENVEDSVDVNQTVSNDGEIADTSETEEDTKTEVPVNDESVLIKDNYKKTKSLIQKRFEEMGISDYSIRVNEQNGKIEVEVPYEENADSTIDLVTGVGKVEIVDSDTNEVLMDNSYIKSATAYYTQSSSDSTTVTSSNALDLGIQLDFTKDGLKKLSEISKTYVETIDSEGESQIKSITIKINDEEKYKTYFSVDGNYTYLAIPLYQGVSDDELINDDYKQCVIIQNSINSGKLPIVYNLDSGSYVETNYKTTLLKISVIILIIVVAVISICFILKYKKSGVYASILQIGYIAVLLILIRIAGVTLTITGLVTILISVLLNDYFIMLMLKRNENRYFSAAGRFLLNTIPLILIMIVFNFSNTLQLKSIGMVLFWGFLIAIIYNLLFSKFLLDYSNNEEGAEK